MLSMPAGTHLLLQHVSPSAREVAQPKSHWLLCPHYHKGKGQGIVTLVRQSAERSMETLSKQSYSTQMEIQWSLGLLRILLWEQGGAQSMSSGVARTLQALASMLQVHSHCVPPSVIPLSAQLCPGPVAADALSCPNPASPAP